MIALKRELCYSIGSHKKLTIRRMFYEKTDLYFFVHLSAYDLCRLQKKEERNAQR